MTLIDKTKIGKIKESKFRQQYFALLELFENQSDDLEKLREKLNKYENALIQISAAENSEIAKNALK